MLHLRHFWFAEWSDQRAPAPPALQTHLLCLLLEVLQLRRPRLLVESIGVGVRAPAVGAEAAASSSSSGPALVHCSAGLGRTGCFVALYKLLCETLLCGGANVARAVAEMRLDRGGLVQNFEQYELIYRTLVDLLDALGAENAQQAAAAAAASAPVTSSAAQQPFPLPLSLSDLLSKVEPEQVPSFTVGFFSQ